MFQRLMLPIFWIAVLAVSVQAQSLYMPRNIKTAYEKGTRAPDGRPGPAYWQNKGVYDLSFKMDPVTRILSGEAQIQYSNISPDSLKVLPIRFVNNIHKPTSPRSGQVAADFLDQGLTLHQLRINGADYQADASGWGTVADIPLKTPIAPGTTTQISISWSYPLSRESGREGQINATTFYAAYSYPRITVYDDYNGWDRIPHTDRAEFYNDFNDYRFSVAVPQNYVVYATGDFLNPREVLLPGIADRLEQSYNSDSVITVADASEMQQGKVTRQQPWNVWKFKADHITDICFALSSSYVWQASSVIVDNRTGRRASTQAAYEAGAQSFLNSVRYNNYALAWFSNNWPGVPYPFSKMIAFQGFADMEYPMMVNDSKIDFGSEQANDAFGRLVQDHEIAHTYFPFYMGINETRYAFMDEGWATALEYLIGISYAGKPSAEANFKGFRVKRWIGDPSAEQDQPIITMSTQVSGPGYGNNSYGKAALSYLALKDLLGDSLFKKGLHFYMEQWNGKHPIPWDYFNAFNTGTGQDLDWFFQNWFFTNNYIDVRIQAVDERYVSVENRGGFAIPFDLVMTFVDGRQKRFHYTPTAWKSASLIKLQVTEMDQIKTIEIDGGIFMDATPEDNKWNRK
ncbi:M1 family metallopeptidase [Niabella terrae]